MNDETVELLAYLKKISDKSLKGEISWSQPNPSTFQWAREKNNKFFLVTIQKAEQPTHRITFEALANKDNAIYLFQVQDRSSKQTLLSLSSKERPETLEALSGIFHSAEKGMDVQATNILKNLVDNDS